MTRKCLLGLLLAVSAAAARAELESPFPSTVPGLSIRNAHAVGPADSSHGRVLRGSSPLKKTRELARGGTTRVLIFKNQSGDEVRQELAELEAVGLAGKDVRWIPFPWKKFDSFQQACEQTVSGLDFLLEAYRAPGQTVYFHCTVGEDRTGYLAGLFRLLTEPRLSVEEAFRRELCRFGYSAGDPRKPSDVVKIVDDVLTPAFLKMAALIRSGQFSMGRLDASVCARAVPLIENPGNWRCAPSPLADPSPKVR